MKKMLLIMVLLSVKCQLSAQENLPANGTTIYLVRHAEKENGTDPVLTAAGKKRAGDLMRKMGQENVSHIYVTRTRRSEMTADSMRLKLAIDTVHYDYDLTGDDLIAKIKANHDFGKTILIIGHSNTVPQLIKVLGIKVYQHHDIPDDEFDNMYRLTYEKGEVSHLQSLKYGDKSGRSGTMKND